VKLFDICASAAAGVRRIACMFCLGGPVGVYHTIKLRAIRRRLRKVAACIDCEKDQHRDNLRSLNHQITQLVMEQQDTSQAAAEFWRWCEKKAGVQ
jgi:hypothetical protein